MCPIFHCGMLTGAGGMGKQPAAKVACEGCIIAQGVQHQEAAVVMLHHSLNFKPAISTARLANSGRPRIAPIANGVSYSHKSSLLCSHGENTIFRTISYSGLPLSEQTIFCDLLVGRGQLMGREREGCTGGLFHKRKQTWPYHEVFKTPHSPSSWDRCCTGSLFLMVWRVFSRPGSRCRLLKLGNQMLSYTGGPRGASTVTAYL